MSSDGLTYTVTLRDGLNYSDGTKITAEDFVYTWQRMVDPATASEYALPGLQILTLLMLQTLLLIIRALMNWVLRLREIKLSLPCQILLHNSKVFVIPQTLFHNIRNL